MKLNRTGLAALILAAFVASSAMANAFRVSDIRLQGLQRVSAGTVFNLMPINVGDMVGEVTVRQMIRLLFRSGYFDDVRMARDGNILIVTLKERPAIEAIEIDGNKAIKTENLLKGLAEQGLKQGEIFQQATLERVGLELERQYVAQGRYGASLTTDVTELPRNRVNIKIEIEEGKSSGVRHINVVGNTVFEQQALLEELELKHPTLFSFFRGDDKYTREKLSGDLETIESYYQDRGYVEFEIDSTEVSITPDRREVYISIGVAEGEKYSVNEVELVGELNDVDPEVIERLFIVRKGQTFSRALVTATEERIETALGNSGYTFASASGVPQVNDDGTVDVRFLVDTGKRAYVRRITFTGNAVTQDHVLRREMRQMEGGWASSALVELSKVRLERLGYFEEVNLEMPEVPGADDQIDVDFSVSEQPSGSISATLGYAEYSGLIIGASYQERNVFGTGNSLTAAVSFSDFQKSASFSYFNPYFTADGISRGYNLYFRRSDFEEANIARFSTDAVGAGVNFGMPIGETQRLQFGLNVEHTDITEGLFPALEISDFLRKEGNTFLNFKLEGMWRASTLNRGLFATRGRSQTFSVEVSVPGSDLEFFRVNYQGELYIPLFYQDVAIRLRTEAGYGEAYGKTDTYPFYEHFFSGGFGSVRGFESRTLGPRTTSPEGDVFTDLDGDPLGGNLLVEASAELVFPIPFVPNPRQFRSVLFFDAGNVFNTNCPQFSTNCFDFSTDRLRYAAGASVTWLTGMGPMTFALAFPLNDRRIDETERFSFELGRTF